MRPLHAAVLLLSAYTTSGQEPLKILRTAPSDEAAPTSVVAVTFDRPVAGSLDRTVDPKAIFTITPALKGRLDWRDPVAIPFTPAPPPPPHNEDTRTLADTLPPLGGGPARGPRQFSFPAPGPPPP